MRGVRVLLPALVVLASSACGDDAGSRIPPNHAPEPKAAKAERPPAKSGRTIELTEEDAGSRKTVEIGDRVLIELLVQGGADGRGDPEIEGDAIRFVNRHIKRPAADGDRTTEVFELRAVYSGDATVKISLESKGAAAGVADFRMDFAVTQP